MGMINIFLNGIQKAVENIKMWLILFGIQFVFAVILVLPLRAQLDKMLGHSLMGQDVLQGFGATAFFEFITHYADAASLEMKLLMIVGIVYLIATLFLNGGILGLFVREETFSARGFFENCGQYFGRFFRLFLISILYIIVAYFIHIGLDKLLGLFTGDSEPLKVIYHLFSTAFFLFLLFFINMVFDYAKIRTVFLQRRDMFKTALRSWGFVFQHLGKTLGLYYIIVILGIMLFLIYTYAGKLINASTSIGILLLLIWQQGYAFSRMGVRLTFLSSQTLLFKELTEPYMKAWFKEEPK